MAVLIVLCTDVKTVELFATFVCFHIFSYV